LEALAGAGRRDVDASSPAPGALVFVGFMGAGKSSAARAVAAELGAEALDSDRELERELGEPLEIFFDREGEEAFREREQRVVTRMLDRRDVSVAALGGGALGSEAVRAALARHTVVYLEVSPEEAWDRAAGKSRPLARDRERFERLHGERTAVYEAVASATLPGFREVPRRALGALMALSAARAGAPGTDEAVVPRMVWARSESGDYPVFVASGLLASGFFYPDGIRRFVVTDENVGRVHALAGDGRVTIPAGEAQKTMARAEAVMRQMAQAGVGREDLVVALGGGVVGDLAGFCAATYQRGTPYVQVPTTLVAQVDSAYGGKTGVDLPEAKNYVGAYHQPASVLVDPATLSTLPGEERAAGYSEVVKTALIAGGDLWTVVARGAAPDEGIIFGCLRTKLAVVAADERDAGPRQALNLGHTVAHAIEAATGYRRYRHGEAVAIGLLCALRLSGRDALRSEVAELLGAHGLPLRFEGAAVDDVLALIARDKKRRGGAVPFVLMEAPGRVTPGHELPEAEVRAAVEEASAA